MRTCRLTAIYIQMILCILPHYLINATIQWNKMYNDLGTTLNAMPGTCIFILTSHHNSRLGFAMPRRRHRHNAASHLLVVVGMRHVYIARRGYDARYIGWGHMAHVYTNKEVTMSHGGASHGMDGLIRCTVNGA